MFRVVRAIWLAAGRLGILLVDTIRLYPSETERPLTREFEPSGFGDEIERMKGREDALVKFLVRFLTLLAAVYDCLAARTRDKFTCDGSN